MLEALEEARNAWEQNEVPVGAVVVSVHGRILGRAHNMPVSLNDPTAHAEILALRRAAYTLHNYRLNECIMYVTMEPCIMCAGALVYSRIRRLVYGAPDIRSGAVHSLFELLTDDRLNHRMEVTGGMLQEECARLLTAFFSNRRKNRGEVPKWP
jgi:tRNA(adenine34) deaminase